MTECNEFELHRNGGAAAIPKLGMVKWRASGGGRNLKVVIAEA